MGFVFQTHLLHGTNSLDCGQGKRALGPSTIVFCTSMTRACPAKCVTPPDEHVVPQRVSENNARQSFFAGRIGRPFEADTAVHNSATSGGLARSAKSGTQRT